ncbi:uncharacterized protein LOC129786938 isoform X2 [Lutzomyia longipalpis]|uniref:uncharacterized protein LOC129786938 isoform X2 n=1 Tax=Lutzomyia longipalpis TaxID=7200 RepID=UPI002483CA36|nr:uncharacterized protein LOC129786938 isoform X2 [Lutzomyia longipalpis]
MLECELGSKMSKETSAAERPRPNTLEFLSKFVIFEPSMGQVNGERPDGGHQLPEKEEKSAMHEDNIIRETCNCSICMKYRECIIQIYLEDLEYNILWERLQLIIRKYYDLIPDDPNSPLDRKYRELMSKSATKWLSDGQLDFKKNIQISLGSNLPLTNEMTFILVFSMLYSRDPHQLFELLCIQVRCLVMAYAEGLKDIIKYKEDGVTPEFNSLELTPYVLDGYEKICNAATVLTPLLFENQSGHLQQFSLTWILLNKRLYHKFISSQVQYLIPQCLAQLRLISYDDTPLILKRYFDFSDEFMLTTEMWKESWLQLQSYHMSQKDIERRQRILTAHTFLELIRNSRSHGDTTVATDINSGVLDWLESQDKEYVWQNTLAHIRTKWTPCTDKRLAAPLEHNQCLHCNVELADHKLHCECRTCLIAGGPVFSQSEEQNLKICAKCCFKTFDRDYLTHVMKFIHKHEEKYFVETDKGRQCISFDLFSTDGDASVATPKPENQIIYHLSWAVFKHLPGRVPYTVKKLDLRHLCMFRATPCRRVECRVATHLIVALYPFKLTKFLLNSYQPLSEELRKKFFRNPNNNSSNYLHLLYEDCNLDTGIVASVFAECYLTDFTFPPDEEIFPCFQFLFKTTGADIEIDLGWLECIHITKAMILESKVDTAEKKSLTEECLSVADLKIQMENLKLSGPSCEDSDEVDMKLDAKTTADKLMKRFAEGLEKAEMAAEKAENPDPVDVKPSKEFKTEVLTEAMRLARSRKLNKKLEAELRTLKKEHSALKDMMRDLEQIKESENKLLKTEKGSAKCCADHSEILENCRENHSSKLCHKGDGQCTCYYCTIFGHTVRKTRSKNRECNHGRNNETRDRLRKRLHQIHNNKEMKPSPLKNFKVAPGLFKSVANTAKMNSSTSAAAPPPPKEAPSAVVAAAAVAPAANPVVPQPPIKRKLLPLTAKDVPLIKPATPGSLVSEEVEGKMAAKQSTPSCNSSAPSSVGRRDSSSCGTVDGTSPLNDILQFIEGAKAPKVCDGKESDKKAAKKERQRQKKLELKKLDELEVLKVQFHGDCAKENEAKMHLKTLKAVKKKDKKKINEQDAELKRLTRVKSKTESAICEIICEIRENNPEFNFNYQPPKDVKVKAPPAKAPESQQAKTPTCTDEAPLVAPQFVPMSKSTVSSYVTSGQNPSQMNCEISLDPTKRMVTIRRINLPHAEPQVTVTAKGASPDKDQLLYSFINGQMVPASSLDPSLLKSLQPSGYNMEEQYHASLQQHKQAMQNQPTCQQQCCTLPSAPPTQQQLPAPKATKTKKVESQTNNKSSDVKTLQKKENAVTAQKLSKKLKKAEEITAKEAAVKETAAKDVKLTKSTSKKEEKEEKKQNGSNKPKAVAKQNSKEEIKAEKKEGKPEVKLTKADSNRSKLKKNSGEGATMQESRQVYEIDPEFKINKFGVLDTDDYSDVESTSSDMHRSPVQRVEVPTKEIPKIQPNPPQPTQQSKSRQRVKEEPNRMEKLLPAESKKSTKGKIQENLAPVQARSVPEEQPPPQLTKKQKKKLLQQEKNAKMKADAASGKVSADKNVTRAEKVAKSLSKSMLKLHLNADTTIELVNDCKSPDKQKANNISIMEQLNRGIKVEGLTLPPGITLTRVDQSMAETVKAKKESIGRLCTPITSQQQQQQQQQHVEPPRPPPHMLMANAMNGAVPCGMAPDGSGLIMVDPMSNIRRAAPQPPAAAAAAAAAEEPAKKGKKKNKRRGKGAKEELPNSRNRRDSDAQKQTSKIITLRNPMFHAVTDAIRHQSVPLRPQSLPGMTGDPPAAIIKNENGMFTIRNPALHQALSSGVGTNFRQYSPNVYGGGCPTDTQENFSYFSDGMTAACNGTPAATTKCNSAIGSEMRNVQQKQMPWQPHQPSSEGNNQQQQQDESAFNHIHTHFNPQPTGRSYSPFDNQQSYGFNGDFLGGSRVTQSHGYFSSSGAQMNGSSPGSYSVFSGSDCSANHQPINTQSRFSGDMDEVELSTKLSELSFLQNLQPGQRLNSEVTIHNISESKFLRNQSSAAANVGSNKVEITRIPSSTANSCDNNLNLAVGSHRAGRQHGPRRTSNGCSSNGTEILPEFGDSIFAPNQQVNLNELESEERDIETFKRFNYYFEPPKNKPKVNLNLKDIVLNKKKCSPESPSMFFGGPDGNSITSTPSLDEMLQQDYPASQSSDDAPPGLLHEGCNGRDGDSLVGVIGSGLKAAAIHGNLA